jgi:hypothetical protein
LQTVWAITPDLISGRRRTDIEKPADLEALLDRLAQLVPMLFAPPAAAAHTEGSATTVAEPGPAHPAAGDLAAAA